MTIEEFTNLISWLMNGRDIDEDLDDINDPDAELDENFFG